MNFYHAYYKVQYCDENTGLWKDTWLKHQSIFIIASNYNDARLKIKKCLRNIEKGNHRAILNRDIVECIGFTAKQGFGDSFYLNPIIEEQNIIECE